MERIVDVSNFCFSKSRKTKCKLKKVLFKVAMPETISEFKKKS